MVIASLFLLWEAYINCFDFQLSGIQFQLLLVYRASVLLMQK
jgi:hypothetical protein